MTSSPRAILPSKAASLTDAARIDALKCEVCLGWFLPSPNVFGCPWCAAADEMQPEQKAIFRALISGLSSARP